MRISSLLITCEKAACLNFLVSDGPTPEFNPILGANRPANIIGMFLYISKLLISSYLL